MQHDVLGEVQQSACQPFDAIAVVRYGARDIRVGLSRDGEQLETTLALAAEVVRRLAELDKRAKGVVVTDLLETYNSGWKDYDEALPDGSPTTVTSPELSEAEFEAKLSLEAINVTGARMLDFFYDDEEMFWGHSVVVNSLSGIELRDAQAELVG